MTASCPSSGDKSTWPPLYPRRKPVMYFSMTCILSLTILLLVSFSSVSKSDFITRKLVESSDPWPDLAWLVSFPHSDDEGYIERMIQLVSKTTTGTNIGPELGQRFKSIPFVAHSMNGPYRFNNLPFPDRYILTKTHCTGLISRGMYVKQPGEFLESCANGHHLLDGSVSRSIVNYEINAVKKAVHHIRNPFDNIVSRFRHEFEIKGGHWNRKFDRDGFMDWCMGMDSELFFQEQMFLDNRVVRAAMKVPCHGEFFQYIQWHNNAFEAFEKFRIPIMTVHFEDFFNENRKNVIDEMFAFLELPQIGKPLERTLKTYLSFFSQNEIVALSSFMKVLASETTWVHMKKYLPLPDLKSEFSPIGSSLSPYYGHWPKVAWLLSFPNSGTYFTTHLVEVATQTTTATNYGLELGDRYLDIPNLERTEGGPYRFSRRSFPDDAILTKTHCTGHCNECPPSKHVTTPELYLQHCATGVAPYTDENGDNVGTAYSPENVKKVVHLVRSPLDNIVARFHFAYKHNKDKSMEGWNYAYNRKGFQDWCKNLDAQFDEEKQKHYGDEVVKAMQQVPCHGEFYQYIQWHNNAISTYTNMGVPSMVQYYEDFHYQLNQSLSDMLDFLEMPFKGKVTPFVWKGGYPGYYSKDGITAILEFIRVVGSQETFDLLKRYFDIDEVQVSV